MSRTTASNPGAKVDLASLINLELHHSMEIKFIGFMLDGLPANYLTLADRKGWMKWRHDEFFERALKVWPDPANVLGGLSVETQIKREPLQFNNFKTWRNVDKWFFACVKIFILHGSPEVSLPEIIKIMIKRIEQSNSVGANAAIQLRKDGLPHNIDDLWLKWEALRQRIDSVAREAVQWTSAGGLVFNDGANQQGDDEHVSRKTARA